MRKPSMMLTWFDIRRTLVLQVMTTIAKMRLPDHYW